MHGNIRSTFAGLLLCLVGVLLVPAQASARTVYYEAKDGNDYRLRLPDDFSEFRSIPPVVLPASHTVVGRLNECRWAVPAALNILGGAEIGKGISFEKKVTDDRIFILFFNREYSSEVLDGIDMKRKRQDVIGRLGAPQFENKELKLFGYKGVQYYVFFKGEDALDGIAVYPRDTDAEKAEPDKHYSAGVQTDDYISAGKSTCEDISRIYNNYEGRIMSDFSLPRDYARLIEILRSVPELPPGDEDIFLDPDTDFVFSYECEREDIAEIAAGHGFLSPGRQRVLSYTSFTGGNSFITINRPDGFQSEIKQYTGFISTWTWLNDRYVMYCGIPGRRSIMIFDSESRSEFPLNGKDYEPDMIYHVLAVGKDRMVYTAAKEPGNSWDYASREEYQKAIEAVAEKYEQLFSFAVDGKIVLGDRHRLAR